MTSLAEEWAEHERWKRLLASPAPVYDKLLENEFETAERHRVGIALALASMLRFAAREVPYYRDAFRHANAGAIDRNPMDVLAALPLLTKLEVQDAGKALRAEHLPPSDQPFNWSQSSGTTGRPTRVLHSKRSATMFRFLSQRGARWHRLEPSAKFAEMRVPSLLPRREDGSEVPPGETITRPAWPSMENFATGPFIGMNILTPIEERIAWLRRERPDYLMTYSQTLELLGLATGDEPPAESLKAVIAISEQLTPSMRRYVERRFGTLSIRSTVSPRSA